MKSATVIRWCSGIIMVLIIILGVVFGGMIMSEDEDYILLGLALWVFSGVIGIFQFILCLGFSDIIDNTYNTYQTLVNNLDSKLSGKEQTIITVPNTEKDDTLPPL